MSRNKMRKEPEAARSFGAPLSTPAPGQAKKKRPKVGDKSDDTRLLNPKKRTPSKPDEPKGEGSVRRDYRGVKGVVADAEKGKT